MRGLWSLTVLAPFVQAAELCDISLTPSQLMMATFETGAEVTKYTNLRVDCKTLYRRSANEVVKVDVPLHYRACYDEDGEYDAEKNTCVKYECPRVCSIWDRHCGKSGREDPYPANTTHWPKFAAQLSSKNGESTMVSKDKWSEVANLMHNWDEVGNYWWNRDDPKYRVEYTAFDGCHEAWDHENHKPLKDTCRCGIVQLFKAVDVNNRNQHDHPPHKRKKTDNYYLKSHHEIRFPARKYVGSECQSDEQKLQNWLRIFPDFNQSWAMPAFRDRWATDKEYPRTEGIPGRNDNWHRCDSAGNDAFIKLCEEFRTQENAAVMFGHNFNHYLNPDQIFDDEEKWEGLEWCKHDGGNFENYMLYTKQWTPNNPNNDFSHDDYNKRKSGWHGFCERVLGNFKAKLLAIRPDVEEQVKNEWKEGHHHHHHVPNTGDAPPDLTVEELEQKVREKFDMFIWKIHEVLRTSYVMELTPGNRTYHYREDLTQEHWHEIALPIADTNPNIDHGHYWPIYRMPKQMGKPCFQYVEYSDTLKNYREAQANSFPTVIKPVWNCTAPVTVPEGGAMLAPPTSDPAHTLLRLLKREGVETKLQILESAEISSAKVNFFVLDTQETGGNVRKLGPTLAELKASCKIRLNMFFDKDGKRSINNNKWIALKDLPERPANCDGEGVTAANDEFAATLDSLIAAQDVQCNNTQHKMRELTITPEIMKGRAEVYEIPFSSKSKKTAYELDTIERRALMRKDFAGAKERIEKQYREKRITSSGEERKLVEGEYECEHLWVEYVEDITSPEHPLKRANFVNTYGGDVDAMENKKSDFLSSCMGVQEHESLLSGISPDTIKDAKIARKKKAVISRQMAESKERSRLNKVSADSRTDYRKKRSIAPPKPSKMWFTMKKSQKRKAADKPIKAADVLGQYRELSTRAIDLSKSFAKKYAAKDAKAKKIQPLSIFSHSSKAVRKLQKRFLTGKRVRSPFVVLAEQANTKKIKSLEKEKLRLSSVASIEKLSAIDTTKGQSSYRKIRALEREIKQVEKKMKALKKLKRKVSKTKVEQQDYKKWNLAPRHLKRGGKKPPPKGKLQLSGKNLSKLIKSKPLYGSTKTKTTNTKTKIPFKTVVHDAAHKQLFRSLKNGKSTTLFKADKSVLISSMKKALKSVVGNGKKDPKRTLGAAKETYGCGKAAAQFDESAAQGCREYVEAAKGHEWYHISMLGRVKKHVEETDSTEGLEEVCKDPAQADVGQLEFCGQVMATWQAGEADGITPAIVMVFADLLIEEMQGGPNMEKAVAEAGLEMQGCFKAYANYGEGAGDYCKQYVEAASVDLDYQIPALEGVVKLLQEDGNFDSMAPGCYLPGSDTEKHQIEQASICEALVTAPIDDWKQGKVPPEGIALFFGTIIEEMKLARDGKGMMHDDEKDDGIHDKNDGTTGKNAFMGCNQARHKIEDDAGDYCREIMRMIGSAGPDELAYHHDSLKKAAEVLNTDKNYKNIGTGCLDTIGTGETATAANQRAPDAVSSPKETCTNYLTQHADDWEGDGLPPEIIAEFLGYVAQEVELKQKGESSPEFKKGDDDEHDKDGKHHDDLDKERYKNHGTGGCDTIRKTMDQEAADFCYKYADEGIKDPEYHIKTITHFIETAHIDGNFDGLRKGEACNLQGYDTKSEQFQTCYAYLVGPIESWEAGKISATDVAVFFFHVNDEIFMRFDDKDGKHNPGHYKEDAVDKEDAKKFWEEIFVCHGTLGGILKQDKEVQDAVEASGFPDGVDQCFNEIMGDFGETVEVDGLKESMYTSTTPMTPACIAFLKAFGKPEKGVEPDFCALRTRVLELAESILEGPPTTTPVPGMAIDESAVLAARKPMPECCTYVLRWQLSFAIAGHKFEKCPAAAVDMSSCPNGGADGPDKYCWASDRVMEFAGAFYGMDLPPYKMCTSPAPNLAKSGVVASWDHAGDCLCKSGMCNEIHSMLANLFDNSLQCEADANRVFDVCGGLCPVCGDLNGANTDYEKNLPEVITLNLANSKKCRDRTGAWFMGPSVHELAMHLEHAKRHGRLLQMEGLPGIEGMPADMKDMPRIETQGTMQEPTPEQITEMTGLSMEELQAMPEEEVIALLTQKMKEQGGMPADMQNMDKDMENRMGGQQVAVGDQKGDSTTAVTAAEAIKAASTEDSDASKYPSVVELQTVFPELYKEASTCSNGDFCSAMTELPAALLKASRLSAEYRDCNCQTWCGPFEWGVRHKQTEIQLLCPASKVDWKAAISALDTMCQACKANEEWHVPRLPSPEEAFEVEEEHHKHHYNPEHDHRAMVCKQQHLTFYNLYQACPAKVPNTFKERFGMPFVSKGDVCTEEQEEAYCETIDNAVTEWKTNMVKDDLMREMEREGCQWECHSWCDGSLEIGLNKYSFITHGCKTGTRQELADVVDYVCKQCMKKMDQGFQHHMEGVGLMAKAGARAAILDPDGLPADQVAVIEADTVTDRFVDGWHFSDWGPIEQCWNKRLSNWAKHINLEEHYRHIPSLPKLCTVEAACEAVTRVHETIVKERWLKPKEEEKEETEEDDKKDEVVEGGCNNLKGQGKGGKDYDSHSDKDGKGRLFKERVGADKRRHLEERRLQTKAAPSKAPAVTEKSEMTKDDMLKAVEGQLPGEEVDVKDFKDLEGKVPKDITPEELEKMKEMDLDDMDVDEKLHDKHEKDKNEISEEELEKLLAGDDKGMEEFLPFCEMMAHQAFDINPHFIKDILTSKNAEKFSDNTCDEFFENPGTGKTECYFAMDECSLIYDTCLKDDKQCGLPAEVMGDRKGFAEGCGQYMRMIIMVPVKDRQFFIQSLLEQLDIGRPEMKHHGKEMEHHHHDYDRYACEHKCREFTDGIASKFYNQCNADQHKRMDSTFVKYCENKCEGYIPPSCGEQVSRVWQDDSNWPCYAEWTGKKLEEWEKRVDGYCIAGGKLDYDFRKLSAVCRPSAFAKEKDVLCTRFKNVVFNSCSAEQTSEAAFNEYLLKRQKYYGEQNMNDEGHRRWMRQQHFPDMCCHIGNVKKFADYCEDPTIESDYDLICPNGCQMIESQMVTPLSDPAGYNAENAKRKKRFDHEKEMGWRWEGDRFYQEPYYIAFDQTTCDSCRHSCWTCASGLGEELCNLSCREKYCGESEANGWMLYDGMRCEEKRHILERQAEIRMARSFLYTARDVITGCTYHLRNWLVYEQTATSFSTSECTEDDYICPDDEWWNCKPNPKYFKDPCCYHELRRYQCCAPRTITNSRLVPTEVKSGKVAGYVYAKHKEDVNNATVSAARTLVDEDGFMSAHKSRNPVAQTAAAKFAERKERLAEKKKYFLRGAKKKAAAAAAIPAAGAQRKMAVAKTAVSDGQLTKFTNVALNSVNTYVVQEVAAAKSCFASLNAYINSVHKEDLMSVCYEAVVGKHYDHTSMYGAECTIDTDCYTNSCIELPTKPGQESTKEVKRCKSPIDIEGQDFVTPLLKCLFRLGVVTNAEQKDIKKLFLRQNLGLSGNQTDQEIREKVIELYGKTDEQAWEAPLKWTCLGHDGWHKNSEAACLEDKQCNWSHEAKGDGCSNPCHEGLTDTTGISSCTEYCANPNMQGGWESNEVSVFPTCFSAKANRWEYEEQLRRAFDDCNENRHKLQEKCSNHCHTCKHEHRDNGEDSAQRKCEKEAEKEVEHHHEIDWQKVEQCANDACAYKHETHTIACKDCWSEFAWTDVMNCVGKVLDVCKQIDTEVDQVRRQDHRWKCILGKFSYSSDKKAVCKEGGCMSASGPQPASATQCFGTLIQKHATHDSCWSLGSGDFEAKYAELSPLARYHGAHHDTPPKYCWIKRYQAVLQAGGAYKPYVRPPRFGYSCPGYCEWPIDEGRHCEWSVREACDRDWDDLMDLTETSTGEKFKDLHNKCVWETDCKDIEGCQKHSQKKRLCAQKILKQYKEQNADVIRNFEEQNCFKCQHHHWIEWDDFNQRVFSSPSLPEECRWNEAAPLNTTQPCAESCHWQDCEVVFRDCQFKGGSKQFCNEQVKTTLNQCRECQFIRCEDKCENACNSFDEFHWWGQPSEECSGCDSTIHKCYPGAACFEDRACWGEEAPYAGGCSRGCEDNMNHCIHNAHKECWEDPNMFPEIDELKDSHTSLERYCHRAWDHFYRDPVNRLRWKYRDVEYAGVAANANAWKNMDHWWDESTNPFDQKMTLTFSMVDEINKIFLEATNKPAQKEEAALWCKSQGPLANSPQLCNKHPCCSWKGNEWDGECGSSEKGGAGAKDGAALVGDPWSTCVEDISSPNGKANWANAIEEKYHMHHHHRIEIENFPIGKILSDYDQLNGRCYKCRGQWNEWENRESRVPWDTKKTWETCLDSISTDYTACSVCKLGCARACHSTFWNSLACEHRQIEGHGWQKLCKRTYAAAQTELVAQAECSTCKRVRCERECKKDCNDVSSWNWHEHVYRCGACVKDQPIPGSGEAAKCAPATDCWMGDYITWDGTNWPKDSWAGKDRKKTCFEHSHSRLLEILEDETDVQGQVTAGLSARNGDSHAVRRMLKEHPETLTMLRESYKKSIIAADKKRAKKQILRKVGIKVAEEKVQSMSLRKLISEFYNEDLSVGSGALRAELNAAYGHVRKQKAITEENLAYFTALMSAIDKHIYELNREKEPVYASVLRNLKSGKRLSPKKHSLLNGNEVTKPVRKLHESLIRHLRSKSEHSAMNLQNRFDFYVSHNSDDFKTSLNADERSTVDKVNKQLLELHLIKDHMLNSLHAVKGADKQVRNLLTVAEKKTLSSNSLETVRVTEELETRYGFNPFSDMGEVLSKKHNRILEETTQFVVLRVQQYGHNEELKLIRIRAFDDESLRRQLGKRVSSEFHVQRMRALGMLPTEGDADSASDEFSGLSEMAQQRVRDSPLARPEISPDDLDLDRLLGYTNVLSEITEKKGGKMSLKTRASTKRRALNAIGDIIDKNLECQAGDDCTLQSAMCTKFFERGTDVTAKRVTNAIEAWKWGSAPWDSPDEACREFDNRCYVSKDDALKMVEDAADTFGFEFIDHDHYSNCKQHWTWARDSVCTGCATYDEDNCGHGCRCGDYFNTTTAIHARITHEGLRGICWSLSRIFEKTREKYGTEMWGLDQEGRLRRRWQKTGDDGDHVWMHFEWDARLMNGAGGCLQHGGDWVYDVNLPADCYEPENHEGWETYDHVKCNALRIPSDKQCFRMKDETNSRLSFFVRNREWVDGVLADKGTCEQNSCYPDFWIDDKQSCEDLSYCRDGSCKNCKTNEWWNRRTVGNKKECVAVDVNSEHVTDATLCATLGGQLITLTQQKKICKVPAPTDAQGTNNAVKCTNAKSSSTTITTTTTLAVSRQLGSTAATQLASKKESQRQLTTNTTVNYYYDVLECGHLTPRECEAVQGITELSEMDCYMERWDKCETQEECMNSGECEYEFHEWSMRHIAEHEDGGLCVFPHPYLADDFPVGYEHHHHHHHHRMYTDGTETTTTTPNPWKVNIHDWEDRHRLCQRVTPLGYIGRSSQWGCVVVMGELTDASMDLNTRLQKEIGTDIEWTDGTFSHTFNTTLNDYFVSGKVDGRHDSFTFNLPHGKNIEYRPKRGMNASECTKITGKWLGKAYMKPECLVAGHGWGLSTTQTALQGGFTAATLKDYQRNYASRTTFLGSTTPAPTTQGSTTGNTGKNVPAPARDTDEIPITMNYRAKRTNIGTEVFSVGTFACCTDFHEWGSDVWCHGWSSDDKATCTSCGSRWMSFTKWRSWARWIRNRWTSVYQWSARTESPRNAWVMMPNEWRFRELFNNVITEATFAPMKNFISCRGSPTLSCLDALTNGTDPDVSLGSLDMGDEGNHEMGDFKVSVKQVRRQLAAPKLVAAPAALPASEKRLLKTAETANSLKIKIKTVKSVATQCTVVQKSTASATAKASNVFGAGCYTVVQFKQTGKTDRYVGQLVGDCLQFELPAGSSGANANICLTMNSELLSGAVNTEFQTYDFGQLVSPTSGTPYITSMDLPNMVETTSANGKKRLCGDVSLSASVTYCPIKCYTIYRTTEANAPNSCPNLEILQASVEGEVTKIEESGAGNLDMFGNPIVQSFDSNAFGAGEGVVTDVKSFEANVQTSMAGNVDVKETDASGNRISTTPTENQDVDKSAIVNGLGQFSSAQKARDAGVKSAVAEGGAGFAAVEGGAATTQAVGENAAGGQAQVGDATAGELVFDEATLESLGVTKNFVVDYTLTFTGTLTPACITTMALMTDTSVCGPILDGLKTGLNAAFKKVVSVRGLTAADYEFFTAFIAVSGGEVGPRNVDVEVDFMLKVPTLADGQKVSDEIAAASKLIKQWVVEETNAAVSWGALVLTAITDLSVGFAREVLMVATTAAGPVGDTQSAAAVMEEIYVESGAEMEATVAPTCDSTEKMMSTDETCVAFRGALKQSVTDSLAAVSTVAVTADAIQMTNVGVTLTTVPAGKGRRLQAATLDVAYKIQLADAGAGASMSSSLTSAKAKFEAKLSKRIEVAVKSDPKLADSFEVKKVAAKAVVVKKVTITTTTTAAPATASDASRMSGLSGMVTSTMVSLIMSYFAMLM